MSMNNIPQFGSGFGLGGGGADQLHSFKSSDDMGSKIKSGIIALQQNIEKKTKQRGIS